MKIISFQTKVVGAIMLILILLMTGTVMYNLLEGWSFVDAAYFTTVTMTTIGYGDFVPTHDASKIMTMFFAFAGVGIFLFTATTLTEHYFGQRVGNLERTVQKVSEQTMRIITTKDNSPVSRRSYVKDMVIEHKKPVQSNVKFQR